MVDVTPTQLLISTSAGLVSGYIGSILIDNRRVRKERRSLAVAFKAEISLIDEKLNKMKGRVLDFLQVKCKGDFPQFDVSDKDLAIFSANLNRIGLIDEMWAGSLVKYYGRVRSHH
jgi:hypothetical protein